MKIDGINNRKTINIKEKPSTVKNDFSDNFMKSYKSTSKEELENYIKEIRKKGTRLVVSKNYADVKSYKNTIKKYLETIVEYTYTLNKNIGFWEDKYYSTVDTINKQLESLTAKVLKEEKENLDVSSTIDNIQGLLVDLYR
ncbi:YaaR family protein [Clostridium sardiniense]|uniref:YaaR family protein n=1 Tax=Clostridium sardiniense TaxID=29369 RepID=A0ABS7KV38_CLOSR|nr:YaaR family protein [Clostridium sardiniense]MBM7835435.1 uncharacterized protein YaaR (DUF327 family) [Clostridium sardiniense]MBY0754679.1 YaaR family protein [Clostridium sardiniense]MDQ0460601.1 uncharacterized protein YaaR (DUF327 family) [Clostridium sardiniense]